MPRNTVTEQFRQAATEEQWHELVVDHETLSDRISRRSIFLIVGRGHMMQSESIDMFSQIGIHIKKK